MNPSSSPLHSNRSSSPIRSLASRDAEPNSPAVVVQAALAQETTPPPQRGFFGRMLSRFRKSDEHPTPATAPAPATASAAASAPALVTQDQVLAEQARRFVPAAEVVAREVAYDRAQDLWNEWTLFEPEATEADLQDWRTMFQTGRERCSRILVDGYTESAAPESSVVLPWRAHTPFEQEAGYEWEVLPDPQEPASRAGSWSGNPGPSVLVDDHFISAAAVDAETASREEREPETVMQRGKLKSAHPARDDSFRIVWGRIVQSAEQSSANAEETTCFIGLRGTCTKDGWAADFFTPSAEGLQPGEVRFHKLVEPKGLFRTQLDYALAEADRTQKRVRIVVTGHSLGGSDCERYGALFCHMIAQIAIEDPSIADKIAGVTIIPFNSPGSNPVYGELLTQAAHSLEERLQVACIDMKQDGDWVQRACGSRLSVEAPQHSTILKMKNARLGRWHTDSMTIEGKGRRFRVSPQPLLGEQSRLEKAQGSQISSASRPLGRTLNRLKGAVPRLAQLLLARDGQLTPVAHLPAEELRAQALSTAESLVPAWFRAQVTREVVAQVMGQALDRVELADEVVTRLLQNAFFNTPDRHE